MNAETIFAAVFAALCTGAGVVWAFMTGQLKAKDKELEKKDVIIKEKDEKIDKLGLKTDRMAEDITALKVALAEIKTKNNTLELFESALVKFLSPLKEPKKTKVKDIKVKV
jgi:hypothetical protein